MGAFFSKSRCPESSIEADGHPEVLRKQFKSLVIKMGISEAKKNLKELEFFMTTSSSSYSDGSSPGDSTGEGALTPNPVQETLDRLLVHTTTTETLVRKLSNSLAQYLRRQKDVIDNLSGLLESLIGNDDPRNNLSTETTDLDNRILVDSLPQIRLALERLQPGMIENAPDLAELSN